jgi:hypothetical protein
MGVIGFLNEPSARPAPYIPVTEKKEFWLLAGDHNHRRAREMKLDDRIKAHWPLGEWEYQAMT